MFILRTRNKITDFLMILAWASPFKFIMPEFVSYLGERRVLCVGNGTPVFMNMSSITFEVPRFNTFVFKKCSEKIHLRLNIVIRA